MPSFPALLRDDVTEAEAERLQGEFKARVQLRPLPMPRTATGVDIAYQTTSSAAAVAAAVTVAIPSMKLIETAQVAGSCPFPYVPGLLAFRELNLVSRALQTLDQPVEVLLYDGHGIAHPRRFGAASQLGLAFGIPSIGCAKNRFHGSMAGGLEAGRFATAPIRDDATGEVLGVAMRMQDNAKPVYVSPGHLADIASAVEIVKACAGGSRLPEPIRQADATARKHVRFFEE
ncbi:MAG: endonuclease V [Candidatus Lokiarchaeota archaeon]|nr:endonuclease V [Candidatus Lokiarchaeota archaeon]